jgi:hypothetical protein
VAEGGVNFTDESEVRRWLKGRLPKAGILLATRAALRALPMIGSPFIGATPAPLRVGDALFIQSAFHALAVAWAASRPFLDDTEQSIAKIAARAAQEARSSRQSNIAQWTNPAASAAQRSASQAVRAAAVAESQVPAASKRSIEPTIQARAARNSIRTRSRICSI